MSKEKITLVELFDNKPLIAKLNSFIDEGKTLQYLTAFANKMGVEVSQGTINNYKKKREEAIEKDVPLESLLDKRTKSGNIIELKGKEVQQDAVILGNEEGVGVYKKGTANLINVNQVLEKLIAKGEAALEAVDYVDQGTLLKAIDQHTKLNAGNGGLTLSGLHEMKLKQLAFESAMTDTILKFIPEEKHEEVLTYLEDSQNKWYHDMDMDEEGRRIKKELERLDIM